MTGAGRVIPALELEAMFRDTGGVRITHGEAVTWGHWRGRPELAFVEPGIRDTDQFVRLVGELLPDAAIDTQVLVERFDEAGEVVEAVTFSVRDRLNDPHSAFSDLHLSARPV